MLGPPPVPVLQIALVERLAELLDLEALVTWGELFVDIVPQARTVIWPRCALLVGLGYRDPSWQEGHGPAMCSPSVVFRYATTPGE